MPIPERHNPSFASSLAPAPDTFDPTEEAKRRLIVALDVPSAEAAIELVNQLETCCQWFKVGLELFMAAGPAALEPIIARGHSVFLDLKFHDIPNTVAGAVRSAAELGVRMVTVHATGGPAMLAAARAALEGFADPPQLLAVTVLTSMDQAQMRPSAWTARPLSRWNCWHGWAGCGIRGFVCSRGGGCNPARDHRPGRRFGDSRHSARRSRKGRPEAYCNARPGAAGRRELPGCWPAHYAGTRPVRLQKPS